MLSSLDKQVRDGSFFYESVRKEGERKMEQKEIMIRLKGITKAFPQKKGTLEVLHGIDLDN